MFAHHVAMVKPGRFYLNLQTATDNHFQNKDEAGRPAVLQQQAIDEFDRFVDLLKNAGVEVTVFEPMDGLDTPDDLFPNNWFSTHVGGQLILYPMKAPNRRMERRESIISALRQRYPDVTDLHSFETQGKFLEGTGSLVIHPEQKLAFAAMSERTHPDVIRAWRDATGYDVLTFHATDRSGRPVYHTNVVMHFGNGFTVIAAEAIPNAEEREKICSTISGTGNELIRLSIDQMNSFAGNGLQLTDKNEAPVYVLSLAGWNSLLPEQQEKILSHTTVITPDLSTIERVGGGSARCMLAELFGQK